MSSIICGPFASQEIQTALRVLSSQPGRADTVTVYLVEEDLRQRTPAQNRLFRKLLRAFAQQLGGSVAMWHDRMVERFLGYDEVLTEDGYTRQVLCSTSELSVTEFTQFLNACLALAAEHNIHLA